MTQIVEVLPDLVKLWHDADEGVRLSIEDEFAQSMTDVEEGVTYCPPGIDWEAVIDEMWGW